MRNCSVWDLIDEIHKQAHKCEGKMEEMSDIARWRKGELIQLFEDVANIKYYCDRITNVLLLDPLGKIAKRSFDELCKVKNCDFSDEELKEAGYEE